MMRWLECRIPPPLVGLLCALLMTRLAAGGAALLLPSWAMWPLLALALLLDGSAVLGFIRQRTTINPLAPQKTRVLVVNGCYRISRNPMYLGMLCLLLAWACYLQAPQTLLGPLLFMLWITRFQIRPEERALQGLFGAEYDAYCRKVRRWC